MAQLVACTLDFPKSPSSCLSCLFSTRRTKDFSYLIGTNVSDPKTSSCASTNQSCHYYPLGTELSTKLDMRLTRRGGKGERLTSAWSARTSDCSPSRAHFDFPSFLRLATQARRPRNILYFGYQHHTAEACLSGKKMCLFLPQPEFRKAWELADCLEYSYSASTLKVQKRLIRATK